MVCSTRLADEVLQELSTRRNLADAQVTMLGPDTRLPITIEYSTPRTLGTDRVAAACGARKVCGGKGCVVIDAGTCITVDYIDSKGVYHGGAILPGLSMKFKSLHTFTAQLPLIEDARPEEVVLTGRSTRDSIVAGVLTATRFEIDGFVRQYKDLDSEVQVLLTGGDAHIIGGYDIEPQLVMIGLNEIIIYNEKK